MRRSSAFWDTWVEEHAMLMSGIPFGTTDWSHVEPTEHPGDSGVALWRTRQFGALRVRMVEYTPGYTANHWCEKGYLAWLAITSVGLVAFVFLRLRVRAVAIPLLGLYGAFGLDGLAHYTLALCSEHTVMANVTIWSEAIAGVLLLFASALGVRR